MLRLFLHLATSGQDAATAVVAATASGIIFVYHHIEIKFDIHTDVFRRAYVMTDRLPKRRKLSMKIVTQVSIQTAVMGRIDSSRASFLAFDASIALLNRSKTN